MDWLLCNRPIFAHDMWNQNTASRSLLPRSTNIAEGWHRGFNSMLGCSNPAIWKFLDCVKVEQSLTDLKKTKKIMKERPEQRAARWIHYDRRIQELVDDYQNYANKMNFLKAIRYLTMRLLNYYFKYCNFLYIIIERLGFMSGVASCITYHCLYFNQRLLSIMLLYRILQE